MNTQYSEDERWMRRCLELAERGRGQVAPNPMVGAVLVSEGKLIAEGYHEKFGGPHAEVNALANIPEETDLKKATLYCNLEPCSHFGKTPPCADLIIKRKVGRVVIGGADLNPKVSGQGVKRLIAAGIQVKIGVCSEESLYLNRRFYTAMHFGRPYLILKWAESADRLIGDPQKGRVQISGAETLPLVHRWRSEEQAIMVGTNTARLDDPALTVRHFSGNNPIRVVIDRDLTLPKSLKLFCDGAAPTWVINQNKEQDTGLTRYIKVDFKGDFIAELLKRLAKEKINSVLVEGGAKLHKSFIESRHWDELRIIKSTKPLGSGVPAPQIEAKFSKHESINADTVMVAFAESYDELRRLVQSANRRFASESQL